MADMSYEEKRQLAHSYLHASANHATASEDMGDDYFDAQDRMMRDAQAKYPDAREHATVGADSDFPHKLGAGEREHQRTLRERSGYSDRELGERRKAIRGEVAPSRSGARTGARSAVRAGVRGARSYRRAAGSIPGASSAGSITLQAAGVAIGLTLLYLALSPKGSKAFGTLLGGVSGFLRLLVAPIDPLNPSPKAAGNQPLPASGEGQIFGAPWVDVRAPGPFTKTQAHKNKSFGPAPGLSTPLTQGGLR